jgi:hypothetical protein
MRVGLLGRICAAAVAWAALGAAPASAAVEHSTLEGGVEAIYITGEIALGDYAVFRDIADQYPDAVVFLESPGGTVIPALEIGQLVRERGYRTVVLAGSTCTSSCALIWLAGAPRHLESGGQVGFHASSAQGQDGRLVESGVSNAFVGYYLSKLELSERAVVFTTMASPHELTWLTPENSEGAGISFERALDTVLAPGHAATTEPHASASASLSAGQAVAADGTPG